MPIIRAIRNVVREAKRGVDNVAREAGKLKENVDRELTTAKENVDRELTQVKENIDRELTQAREIADRESEKLWRNIVTEYNYFMGSVCGESSKLKKLVRDYNQGKISETEYQRELSEMGTESECGFGVSYDSEDGVALTDSAGQRSDVPPSQSSGLEMFEIYDEPLEEGFSLYGDPELLFKSALFFENTEIWAGDGIELGVFPPNNTGAVRNDSAGAGHFGAPRGNRRHLGVDYLSPAGANVVAPVSGEVLRISNVYRDEAKNRHLRAIVIQNTTDASYTAKVLYVQPSADIRPGIFVERGKTILGVTQSLRDIHPNATDHIHVQIHGPNGIVAPIETNGMEINQSGDQ